MTTTTVIQTPDKRRFFGTGRGDFLVVGFVDLALLVTGIGLTNYQKSNFSYITIAIAATGLVTFLGILRYLLRHVRLDASDAFRHSIASAFLLVYLFLVATQAFPQGSQSPQSTAAATSPLLTSFTTLAGIIAAFYFGSIGVEKIMANRQNQATANQTEVKTDQNG